MVVIDRSTEAPLTFAELRAACGISDDFIRSLREYDIICIQGEIPEQWVFDLTQLRRIKTAIRLQRDLEVNLAGIALVLDMLDELEELRNRAALWERHFN